MKHNEERLTREREEAWIGDAVLALFVREWILKQEGACLLYTSDAADE